MVTSYKMRETEMGNRGSKSRISLVKEQRVDGSCCKLIQISIKVYSNRDKFCFLSHNLPNQIRTKIQVKILLIEKKTKNKTLPLAPLAFERQ